MEASKHRSRMRIVPVLLSFRNDILHGLFVPTELSTSISAPCRNRDVAVHAESEPLQVLLAEAKRWWYAPGLYSLSLNCAHLLKFMWRITILAVRCEVRRCHEYLSRCKCSGIAIAAILSNEDREWIRVRVTSTFRIQIWHLFIFYPGMLKLWHLMSPRLLDRFGGDRSTENRLGSVLVWSSKSAVWNSTYASLTVARLLRCYAHW